MLFSTRCHKTRRIEEEMKLIVLMNASLRLRHKRNSKASRDAEEHNIDPPYSTRRHPNTRLDNVTRYVVMLLLQMKCCCFQSTEEIALTVGQQLTEGTRRFRNMNNQKMESARRYSLKGAR